MGLVRWVYSFHKKGLRKPNILTKLHGRTISSKLLSFLIFRTKVSAAFLTSSYFDLTTVLMLPLLKRLVRKNRNFRLLEIGVGKFAIPSGHISRLVDKPIVTLDCYPQVVEAATEHMRMNKFNLEIYESNVLSNVPRQIYDIIWWNLPYHKENAYLHELLKTVTGYMEKDSLVLLGFNSTGLSYDAFLSILEKYKSIRVVKTRKYRWNLHIIVYLQKA